MPARLVGTERRSTTWYFPEEEIGKAFLKLATEARDHETVVEVDPLVGLSWKSTFHEL